MKTFAEKVAVITGAASGLGRATAHKCASLGMKLVLADIEKNALAKIKSELGKMETDVIAVTIDVCVEADVRRLVDQAITGFGSVHLLCNNAGVGPGEGLLESSQEDWEWGMGVNFFGPLYVLRHFVPLMQKQSEECHIVNTASIAGLMPFHPDVVYHVSKHALACLSEHLYHSLALRGSKIGVSLFCPSYVNTRIIESERNRPESLRTTQRAENTFAQAIKQRLKTHIEKSMSAEEAVSMLFEGIEKNRFYIFTDPDYQPVIVSRLQAILEDRRPEPVRLAL